MCQIRSAGTPAQARLVVAGLASPVAGPFDLTVAAGECVAITGESGAGKSLLLRMIADLDPNTGAVSLDGRDRAGVAAPDWRRQVVYVPAESGWWHDDVAPHFPRLADARAQAERLGLRPELLDGPVLRLSTGERQRLALLRALALDSPMLLLDEPTGALDEASTGRVEAILRGRLDAGCAVLLVTHAEAQAARLGHRRLVMRARRLHPA